MTLATRSMATAGRWADPIRPVVGLHDLLTRYEGSAPSLASLLDRHERGYCIRFLFFNTFLMSGVGGKPEVEERAPEIGQWIREAGIDIAALCEVWTNDELGPLVSAWPTRPAIAEEIAPHAKLRSSGLVTLGMTRDATLRGRRFSAFRHETLRGAEAFARKGVLVTEFSTPFGAPFFVVSTHLTSASTRTRVAQLFELSRVLDTIDLAGGHMVVAGDFNFDALSDEEVRVRRLLLRLLPERRRAALQEVLDRGPAGPRLLVGTVLAWHGLGDLWARRGVGPGFTSVPEGAQLSEACVVRGPPDGWHCRDDPAATEGRRGRRIDYVFVTGPRADQRYRIDTSRIWRPNSRRTPPGVEGREMEFLSDHLGLRVDLLLSPP